MNSSRKTLFTNILVILAIVAVIAGIVFFKNSMNGEVTNDPGNAGTGASSTASPGSSSGTGTPGNEVNADTEIDQPDQSGQTTTAIPEGAITGKTGSPGSKSVTLYMDGWSVKTIAALNPYVTVLDTGKKYPLKFIALNDKGVRKLAKTDPDLLTRFASRMVTADTTLTCDKTGCKTASGDIPFTAFTDAGSVPGFGPSYNEWGVDSVIYFATVPVSDSGMMTVGADGFTEVGADWMTGNHVGVSAGLGRFFSPQAAWLGATTKNDPPQYLWLGGDAGEPAVSEYSPAQLLSGLNNSSVLVEDFSESQMTYRTSPTTGCGIGVTCTPTTVLPNITKHAVKSFAYCSSSGAKAFVVTEDDTLSISYPHATSQWGLWGGQLPTDARKGHTPGYWGQTPPLTTGTHTYRLIRYWVVLGDSGLPSLILGSVNEKGVAPEAEYNQKLNPGLVKNLKGGPWTRCS